MAHGRMRQCRNWKRFSTSTEALCSPLLRLHFDCRTNLGRPNAACVARLTASSTAALLCDAEALQAACKTCLHEAARNYSAVTSGAVTS